MVVPNGFSDEVINKIPHCRRTYDVVFAGRLIKDKHVDTLIKACASASLDAA